jgi:YidC/Oxa1 family membrane protein insertase
MDKNTLIAIVVIFLLVIVFQIIFLRPRLEEQREERVEEVQSQEEELREQEQLEAIERREERERLVVPAEEAPEQTIILETRYHTVQFSTAGASIVSLRLKEYLDQDGKPVELVQFEENDIRPFEIHFDRLRNLPYGDRTTYYVEELDPLTYRFYRDFEDSRGTAFRLSKTYFFQEDDYMFDLEVAVEALDPVEELYLNWDNVSYTLVWGPILGPISVVRNRYNITTQGYYGEGRYHKVLRGAGGCSIRSSESRYVEVSRIADWAGVTNRYFLIGVVPSERDYIYSFDQRTQNKYFFGLSDSYHRGGSFEDRFSIYAGPKDRRILRQYGYRFDTVMSGRILRPLVIFLEWMIRGFYGFTNSYGLSIILMTIVIKIILYPLTRKSFQSMRKMSALQPKITEIREKYKNNAQQMQKETQALYKKEGVNPMGGCLPMILQLPIFYALYTVLSSMIELRNQSFLWIRDLSMPDTVATLSFQVPLLGYRIGEQGFTDINILPFVMTATTLLQSKLTSGDQSNQQAKMMTYLFPIVFFFIFWNMPSGLVLYWTLQNILTIGQQYLIDYRMKKKPAVEIIEPDKKSTAARKPSAGRKPSAKSKAISTRRALPQRRPGSKKKKR